MDGYEDMSIERMLEIVTQLSVVSEEDRERLRHLLIERTGSANIPDESTGLPPSMDPAGGPSNYADSKARLTYDPTEHEYYLFFATMAFVIGIIGEIILNVCFKLSIYQRICFVNTFKLTDSSSTCTSVIFSIR